MLGFKRRETAPCRMSSGRSRFVTGALSLALAAGFAAAPAAVGASSLEQADSTIPVVATSAYQPALFVKGTSAYSHPDSIVADDQHVWVGYQNLTPKDGTLTQSSTIVEYGLDATVVKTFSIPGHTDGLRIDPSTHLVWATVNEDSNPVLYTINADTAEIKTYQFAATLHGGGYDDLAFRNGLAYIVASNPTVNSAGVNVFPAVDQMSLQGGTVAVRPVLMGNANAMDTTTNSSVTLNEVDPDSMTIDPQGNLVLVDQAGAELVFLHNPCTAQQSVTRIPVGTQLDDTVWATAAQGRLFVVDGAQNAVYTLRSTFTPGAVFTAIPNDSGVKSVVGTVDLTTGFVTPIAVGFGSPTGLLFVPDVMAPLVAPSGPASCVAAAPSSQPAQVQLLNPNPGDAFAPGSFILQGVAFDPSAPATAGTGIDSVNVFLDDRDQGGTMLGSATLGLPNPLPTMGSQFPTAGFTLNTLLPNRKGLHTLVIYAHSTVTGNETVLRVPIKIGV
jgi:hypothetical protein